MREIFFFKDIATTTFTLDSENFAFWKITDQDQNKDDFQLPTNIFDDISKLRYYNTIWATVPPFGCAQV
jgi:hypothetical protein